MFCLFADTDILKPFEIEEYMPMLQRCIEDNTREQDMKKRLTP